MSATSRLSYLVAALFALLIWIGASSWSWSRDDYQMGLFPEAGTAAMALAAAFAPYYLLIKLARRMPTDPEGLLLWWMVAAPVVAITLFVGATVALPRALTTAPEWGAVFLTLLAGVGKYELLLATIYGYTGMLLLRLPLAAPRPAA